MGAFVGGLYAREGDMISSSGRVKQFSARMGNLWRMLTDVTYPIVAYTTVCQIILIEIVCTERLSQGHEFNRSIFKVTVIYLISSISKQVHRLSMTSTLKICGYPISATPPI